MDLFDEVKDSKSYWNLVKKASYGSASQPKLGLKTSDGSMETCDYKKFQILNKYFSTAGEKLASDLPVYIQALLLGNIVLLNSAVKGRGIEASEGKEEPAAVFVQFGHFAFDQIFRLEIPGILCEEWNSIFRFVGLTSPRSSGSKFRAKIRGQTEGFFTFVYLLWDCSTTLRLK